MPVLPVETSTPENKVGVSELSLAVPLYGHQIDILQN